MQVLLGSAYGFKSVYIATVVSQTAEGVWVKYPRNSEVVFMDRDTYYTRLRRVL